MRACQRNALVQRRLERLHDVLINLTPPPMAALRALKALEDAMSAEAYAIEETLQALDAAVAEAVVHAGRRGMFPPHQPAS